MKLLCGLCVVAFLVGCSVKEPVEVTITQEPQVLKHISQNITLYTNNLEDTVPDINQDDFEKQYFNAWNMDISKFDLQSVQWAFKTFKYGNSYGENLQLLNEEFFTQVQDNANYETYGNINKNALSLHELNIRAFPSDKPLLRDPSKAGEGFPFDYLQNTTIHANKPLFVTHYSKDKKWVHVFSSFAFGWVKSNEIVFLEDYQVDLWKKAKQVFITQEGTPVYDKKGHFLFDTKLGMMFALISEDKEAYTVLAVSSLKFNKPLFLEVKLSKKVANKGIIGFNKHNVEMIMQEIMKSNYGWGGMYGQRDCSSTLRDFYAPFGVWLPRNSYQQSKLGEVLSLKDLSTDEKRKFIKENAKPFKTLLYKKGHIMLYTGVVDGKITILQNVWGVKTKQEGIEGRYVVGKTIFSTLELGSELENYDLNSSVLQNLQSINTLIN